MADSQTSDHDSNVVLSANEAVFEINDVIQVDRLESAPWYGVIRWIGTLPGQTTLSAGLEMVIRTAVCSYVLWAVITIHSNYACARSKMIGLSICRHPYKTGQMSSSRPYILLL